VEAEKREKKLLVEAEKREEERALEIAQNLLDGGMTVEQVVKFTKMPLSKIKGLQKKE
jgi:hypothetical protein